LHASSSGRPADAYRATAQERLPKPNAKKVVDLVFNLEKAKSVREVTRLLTVGGGRRAAASTRSTKNTPARK
jgi:hypothetical protein